MSPILIRPVREQLEHDRIIRLLQLRYKRRFTVSINIGSDLVVPVGEGPSALYPDLVLAPTGRARKVVGVVEVETGESVNNLEAIAEWARFGRLPVEFALYIPASAVDVAKRLCADHGIGVTEIWTYHMIGDQLRFTLVHRSPIEAKIAAARAAAAAASSRKKIASKSPVKKQVKNKAVKPAARKAAAKTTKKSR